MKTNKFKIIGEGIVGALTIGITVLLSPFLRAWYRQWGAMPEEVARTLPGDEFVPHPKSEITAAITVRAPVQCVWPWFAQLGCQRGGWYSYDLLDNGGAPSAEKILPEFQNVRVGDMIAAVPNGSFGFPVAIAEHNRVLSLAGTLNTQTGKPAQPNDPNLKIYFSGDQTFFMEPISDNATRLIFRMRTDWNATRANNLIYRGIVEPISFVMGRKMLRNVKGRAEALIGQISDMDFAAAQLTKAFPVN